MKTTTYEKRVVEQTFPVNEICTCDVCHKVIYEKKNKKIVKSENRNIGYWNVKTHHSDWGRDSIDSYESKDVCSKECLATIMCDYMEQSSNNYNTQELECEHINILLGN